MAVLFTEQVMGTELLVFERILREKVLRNKNTHFKGLEVRFIYPSLLELESHPEDLHSRLQHANIYAVYKTIESTREKKILINDRFGWGGRLRLVLLPQTEEECMLVVNKANALLKTMYGVMKTRWEEMQPLLWGYLENDKQDDYRVVALIDGGRIRFFSVNSYTQLRGFTETDEGITSVSGNKLIHREAREIFDLSNEKIASCFVSNRVLSLREGLREEAEDESIKQLVLSWVSGRDPVSSENHVR